MSHRPQQVAGELRKALAPFLAQESLQNRYGLITLTDLVVTPGLEHAKVYLSSQRHIRDLCKLLNGKAVKIKQKVQHQINLRKIPKLQFIEDLKPDVLESIDRRQD